MLRVCSQGLLKSLYPGATRRSERGLVCWPDIGSDLSSVTIRSNMATLDVSSPTAASGGSSGEKEYQSLFWLPMMYQTVDTAVNLLDNMLEDIDEFQSGAAATDDRFGKGADLPSNGKKKKRQQILGDDSFGNEIIATRVEPVVKSADTEFMILSVLKSHFLFSRLQDYELQDVVDSMIDEYVEADEIIIQEGDTQGDKFYVLEEGEVEVLVGGNVVANLPSGVSFGDLALMYNNPRAATIRALKNCTLWVLEKRFFRQAMVTSSSNQTVNLSQFLGKLKLFESLSLEGLSQLSKSLTLKSYSHDTPIITQGEIGEHFYIIFKGKVRVTKTLDDGKQIPLITLMEGAVFGERALIKKEPRAANVISDGHVECYTLASKDFGSMLGGIVGQMTDLNNFRIMRSMKVFKDLSDFRLGEVKGAIQNHEMFSGQRLLCDSVNLFIIMDGEVNSPEGAIFKSGEVVGSLTEAADEITVSLTCRSDEAVVGLIARQVVEEHLDGQARGEPEDTYSKDGDTGHSTEKSAADAEEKAKHDMDMSVQKRKESYMSRRSATEHLQLGGSLEHLELVRALGQGTFGSVYLVKDRRTGREHALKTLDKEKIVDASQTMYLKRECVALNHFSSPFLGQFYDVCVTASKVFFYMEYVPGGELWNYLYDDKLVAEREKSPLGGFTIQQTTQHVAMIVLALEHIHGLGYCYRDLKPENIMVTADGYLKLVDFGFSKPVPYYNSQGQLQYRTYTLCGTPDYMPPEVVLTHGHDKSVDYWALGVLAYEFFSCSTPFDSPTTERTFEKIVRSQKFLQFPSQFDTHLRSFIRRSMHPNASLRLGALHNGFEDMRSHNLFGTASAAGLTDFDKLRRREVTPFFKPGPRTGTGTAAGADGADGMSAEEKFDEMMKLDQTVDTIDLAEESSRKDSVYEQVFKDLYEIVETDFEELGSPLERE